MADRTDTVADAVLAAIDHTRRGHPDRAVAALQAADPGGFESAYALAYVVTTAVDSPGPIRTEVNAQPGQDRYYYASLGAFIAAAGNGDTDGAAEVFAGEPAPGRMLADLLGMVVALADAGVWR